MHYATQYFGLPGDYRNPFGSILQETKTQFVPSCRGHEVNQKLAFQCRKCCLHVGAYMALGEGGVGMLEEPRTGITIRRVLQG